MVPEHAIPSSTSPCHLIRSTIAAAAGAFLAMLFFAIVTLPLVLTGEDH